MLILTLQKILKNLLCWDRLVVGRASEVPYSLKVLHVLLKVVDSCCSNLGAVAIYVLFWALRGYLLEVKDAEPLVLFSFVKRSLKYICRIS